MRYAQTAIILLLLLSGLSVATAKDRIKLETTIIKGNKEMPQIVYIVPWKNLNDHSQKEQTLVLHSLFGNLFEPVHIVDTRSDDTRISNQSKSFAKTQ